MRRKQLCILRNKFPEVVKCRTKIPCKLNAQMPMNIAGCARASKHPEHTSPEPFTTMNKPDHVVGRQQPSHPKTAKQQSQLPDCMSLHGTDPQESILTPNNLKFAAIRMLQRYSHPQQRKQKHAVSTPYLTLRAPWGVSCLLKHVPARTGSHCDSHTGQQSSKKTQRPHQAGTRQ